MGLNLETGFGENWAEMLFNELPPDSDEENVPENEFGNRN